jgi:hypothetical protein
MSIPSTLRHLMLVAPALALAVVLWSHPAGGEQVFEGVRDDVDPWLWVHTGLLLLMPLLGIAAYLLVRGLDGRPATVSRIGLAFFLVFYTAYEVTVGVGTGLLVDYANGLSADEQRVMAGAIQDYNRSGIVADPSLALALGSLGWVVAMIAAALALRGAGAGTPVVLLAGFASIFFVHPPPVGPAGLLCFSAAAVLAERWRAKSRAHGVGAAARPLRV